MAHNLLGRGAVDRRDPPEVLMSYSRRAPAHVHPITRTARIVDSIVWHGVSIGGVGCMGQILLAIFAELAR